MAIRKKIVLKEGKLYIWLDDRWNDETSTDRQPPEGWMPVADFGELKSLVKRAMKKGICLGGLSFDNDLGEGKKEGKDCAEWIVRCYPEWFLGDEILEVHSDNSSARPMIEGHFRDVRDRRDMMVEMKQRRLSGEDLGY